MRRAERLALSALVSATALAVPGSARAAELNLFPDWGVVAVNVVVFLALIYPTHRYVLRPLVDVLHRREERTSGSLEAAAEAEGEAAELEQRLEVGLIEARQRAQARRNELGAEAQRREREIIDGARSDARETIERMRGELEQQLESARGALRADAEALAGEAAERILGRPL